MYLSLSMAEVSLASSWVLSLDPLMKRFCALTHKTRVRRYFVSFLHSLPVMQLFSLAMLLNPFTRVRSSSPAPELAIPL